MHGSKRSMSSGCGKEEQGQQAGGAEAHLAMHAAIYCNGQLYTSVDLYIPIHFRRHPDGLDASMHWQLCPHCQWWLLLPRQRSLDQRSLSLPPRSQGLQ